MRIIVVGAGSLGCVFAALLKRAGHDAVLVGRGERARLLRDRGIVLRGTEEATILVPVLEDPAGAGPADLLLLCTKALDTARALDSFAGSVRVGAVASLQNGVMKDGLLAKAFGPERVLGAATMLSAERCADGSVTYTAPGTTYLGELDGSPSPRVEAIVAGMCESGLPAQAVSDIRRVEWSKTCLAVASFVVCCCTRLPVGLVYADRDLAGALLDLYCEVAAIAQAAGPGVGDYPGFPILSWTTAPRELVLAELVERGSRAKAAGTVLRPSMLQDLLAGRPLEVDEVVGFLLAEADRLGVAVPCLRWAHGILRGLDPGRTAQPTGGRPSGPAG
jgi:2-dehydropantoate 2-reductase